MSELENLFDQDSGKETNEGFDLSYSLWASALGLMKVNASKHLNHVPIHLTSESILMCNRFLIII